MSGYFRLSAPVNGMAGSRNRKLQDLETSEEEAGFAEVSFSFAVGNVNQYLCVLQGRSRLCRLRCRDDENTRSR